MRSLPSRQLAIEGFYPKSDWEYEEYRVYSMGKLIGVVLSL